MNQTEFQECLRRARAGDNGALDQALAQVRGGLQQAAHRGLAGGLRRHLETADILQTTYLDIVRGIKRFRGSDRASFAAWVTRILNHNIVDEIKFHSRSRRRVETDRTEPEPQVDRIPLDQPTPSVEAIRAEQLLHVEQAIAGLDGPQSQALRMRLLDQLDYATIAERLGRTESAVRMMVCRAQATLALRLHRTG